MLKIDERLLGSDKNKFGFRDLVHHLGVINEKEEALTDVRCFVLIVYGRGQAHLRKALADKNNWEALDEVTGKKLAVIAYQDESAGSRGPEINSFMLKSNAHPVKNFGLESLKMVSEVFAIDVNANQLPVILVFGLNGHVSNNVEFLRIEKSSPEDTFNHLKFILGGLGAHLESFEGKDLENPEEAVRIARDYLAKSQGVSEFGAAMKEFGWKALLKTFFSQ